MTVPFTHNCSFLHTHSMNKHGITFTCTPAHRHRHTYWCHSRNQCENFSLALPTLKMQKQSEQRTTSVCVSALVYSELQSNKFSIFIQKENLIKILISLHGACVCVCKRVPFLDKADYATRFVHVSSSYSVFAIQRDLFLFSVRWVFFRSSLFFILPL